MMKSVLALAVLGAISTGAFAQTNNVTIYGILDEGYVWEGGNTAGNVSKLSSGVGSGSRLGFKGTEDLGGGLSALFVLENGFQADTGAMGQNNTLFGRQAFVGLTSTSAGTVTLGRQYTPEYLVLTAADPFGTGFAGDAKNLFAQTGDASTRMTNSIKYASPNFSGFTAEAAYGFGEVADSTGSLRQYGLAAGYANGPLWARVGYHNRSTNTTAAPVVTGNDNAKNTILAATYDFTVVKAHFAYAWNKGVASSPLRNTGNPFGLVPATSAVASTDSQDLLLGATVPFGPHKILASYIHKNDKNAANNDADQYAIGYLYSLSKRTDLYTAYAYIKNKNNASYTVGNAIDSGTGNKAFNLGIRHLF